VFANWMQRHVAPQPMSENAKERLNTNGPPKFTPK